MSKPDKVKVWEWITGKQAHFHHDFWWDKADLVDAELVQGCTWLSDVLNGLREKDFGVWIFKSGIIIHQFNPDRGGAVGEGPLPEALLAACLKYIAHAS